MLSKPQVIIIRCRVVVPDLPNDTGRYYLPISSSQISMAIHDILIAYRQPSGSLLVKTPHYLHKSRHGL